MLKNSFMLFLLGLCVGFIAFYLYSGQADMKARKELQQAKVRVNDWLEVHKARDLEDVAVLNEMKEVLSRIESIKELIGKK